jgi:hypothetical protein
MLSFVRRMGRVKRVNGCVYRPEQHGAGVSVTLRRNDGAATGSDLDMRKMTVAATLGVPAGLAEGSALGRAIAAGRCSLPQRRGP